MFTTARLKSGSNCLGTNELQSGCVCVVVDEPGAGGGAIPAFVGLLVGLMTEVIFAWAQGAAAGATLGCQYSAEKGSIEWWRSKDSVIWLA